jgi:hypothetical protein
MMALVFDDRLEIHSFDKENKTAQVDLLPFDCSWLRRALSENQPVISSSSSSGEGGGEGKGDFPRYTSAKFSCRDESGDIYLALGGKQGDRDDHEGRAELFRLVGWLVGW